MHMDDIDGNTAACTTVATVKVVRWNYTSENKSASVDSGTRLSCHDLLKLCQMTRGIVADWLGSPSSNGLDGCSVNTSKEWIVPIQKIYYWMNCHCLVGSVPASYPTVTRTSSYNSLGCVLGHTRYSSHQYIGLCQLCEHITIHQATKRCFAILSEIDYGNWLLNLKLSAYVSIFPTIKYWANSIKQL